MFSIVHFAGVIFILIGIGYVAAALMPMCKEDSVVATIMAVLLCGFMLLGLRLLLL